MQGGSKALAGQGVVQGFGGHQGLPQSSHEVSAALAQPLSIKVQVRVIPGGWQEVLGCIGTGHLTCGCSEPPGRSPRAKVGSKKIIGEECPALERQVGDRGSR